MRIFLSCQQALKPHPVPAFSFWEYYLRNALAEAGHEVIETPSVDWAEGLVPLSGDDRKRWLEETWTRTVGHIRAEHAKKPVDFFLGYLFPQQVDPTAVSGINAAGIPTVNFFCDNVREFTEVPAAFRGFTLHWVPEAEAVRLYVSAGLNHVHLPMPMWVEPRYRTVPKDESDTVTFIGSHDILREYLLGDVVGRGLQVRIHGSGWSGGPQAPGPPTPTLPEKLANQFRFLGREGIRGLAMRATYQLRATRSRAWMEGLSNGPIGGEAYFTATRLASVVIGINRCPSFRRPFSDPLRYSRLRDIEAPMLGACYLTEMAPGLGDLYDIGTELETFRDAGELVEKAARLRSDAGRRLRLRQSGQRRALADHTIAKSIATVARKLGLSA